MSPYFQRIKPSIRTRNVRFRSSGSNKCRAGRLALPRCFNAAYFNGKEKDYESGFHYYGTRYYWSEVLTGWLSVDPMMDKYPNISPYNYCMWNPVKLVDPDGMDTLFSFATKLSDADQNKKNEIILSWMRTEGDTPGMVTISMHGTHNEVAMSDVEGTSEIHQSPAQIAELVKDLDNLSDYRTNTYIMNKPTIFLLYCCNTGQGAESFAQHFSSEMQGIVIAPVGKVCVSQPNHRMDNWIDRKTPIDQPWNVFYNGKLITSFIGILPQDWIKSLGGIESATQKIKNAHPWDWHPW